jgi:diguanylate cyclase (GGDEF)-like protein
MQTKSKLLLIVALMLMTLTAATIINVSLNFREYSIRGAIDKAHLSANLVRDGLTAHMVNGMMDKREYFLEQISKNDNVKAVWVSRSASVAKQYGDGFPTESPRDAIDNQVLKTGIAVQKVDEDTQASILRVTIPYKIDPKVSNLNCLQCHDAKRGDTLGIVSMEFDISGMRNSGLLTILKILGINILFLIIVLFLINRYATPYMQLFSNLQDGIKKASQGDFTHKFLSNVSGDAQKVISQLNTLFSKMQGTFGDIKNTLGTFIPKGNAPSDDPLYEAKSIISELSDIYKFKKTIEHDSSKEMVFHRITDVLKTKYQLEHFAFYEVNNTLSHRTLIYLSNGHSICFDSVDKDAKLCRAYRTNTDVISTEFINLCQTCNAKDLKYICIPFTINSDSSLIISITTKTEEEICKVNSMIPSIRNYLEAAKPVIESKILMDKLRDTSLRDAMTGLYNRRFLEEFIDKIMSQAQREKETYKVMMLDVDWFKMVNDTYGHDVGDKVIVEIAKVLKENIREADLAIRYGGEEFVLMLHNPTDEGALKVAQKIHSDFGAIVFDVGAGVTFQKTLSIGMATFPTDGDTIWKCIKYADTALYSAKETGRNKIVEFEESMFKEDENNSY